MGEGKKEQKEKREALTRLGSSAVEPRTIGKVVAVLRILGKAGAGAVWGQGQSSQCGKVCGEAKVGTELGVGCGGALWSWTEHSKGFNGLRDLGQPLP